MLFNFASPVTSHTAAVSIERGRGTSEKREVKTLKSVIKMPLILACPLSRKKYLCTKGVDLKRLIFPVNLCQPACSQKRMRSPLANSTVLLGWSMKRCCLSQRCCTMGHSLSLALQPLSSCFAKAGCQISPTCLSLQGLKNETPPWAAGVKVEQGTAISTKITWPNMFSVTLRCFECEVKDC